MGTWVESMENQPGQAQDTMTIRAGCALSYETDQPTPILLLLKPHADPAQILLKEKVCFGNSMPSEHYQDAHGNTLYKTMLMPGTNSFLYDAIFAVNTVASAHGLPTQHIPIQHLPAEVLRYTFASRYCESDKLGEFAQQRFGQLAPGLEQARAICAWTHHHIAYRYGSGDVTLSAWEALQRGYGVCRDFAHVMIALCRALDLPARYVAGHIPYTGAAEGDIGVDFQAYCEVYLGGHWHTFDPRYNKSYPGRIKIAHGMDAVDAAFATIYGKATQLEFRVWAYPSSACTAHLDDPVLIRQDATGMAVLQTLA